ncbi:MAG TPA: tetratricopeptide repeat protein [Thermomicrobiales bacterium]|nr:tetratricopeptide repeat protein [Thermomicrobiales bacterium]
MDLPPAPYLVPLCAHLLGPVRIAVGNRVIPDHAWPRRSARALLLLLLITPGHRLPRDRVLDLLWPERAPESAHGALRVALHTLRRVLEPDLRAGGESAYVESRGDAVALRSGIALSIDLEVFEATAIRAGTAALADRPVMLHEALALFGGDLLEDEPYTDWSAEPRERLRRTWRRAVLELAELELERCPLQSVPVLEKLLNADPTDEAAHRALMRALATAGRRDEALRQYARCVEELRDELDVEPDVETVALATEIRSAYQVPSLPMPPAAPAGRGDNLSATPTPLIGRGREMESLQDILLHPDVQLVTVTGAGGIGKTRLALAVARQISDDFADGVCFVPLAAIHDPEVVLPMIAHTLEIKEVTGHPVAQLLGKALRERELLLILDNLEQVIDVAEAIARLLEGCPHLTILATSREPLRVRAEHVVTIPPLAVPPLRLRTFPAPLLASSVSRYEAVALFAERSRAARSDFAVTDANALAVAALCTRLDGMPLAIELAAALSSHLAPDDLLARLARRLPLLTGGARDLPERQRTLRDAIAWSHDLLEPAEQTLFPRLAVFVGGFNLDAAEAVCHALGDVIPEVASNVWALADKSLLQREEGTEGGSPRYRMLETIREFGLEKLKASGEEETIRRRHAAFFLATAENAEPLLHEMHQISWRDQLEVEHDNLRAALDWACEQQEAETALGISGALAEFWRMGGHHTEGRMWLARALALTDSQPSAGRALCLRGAGVLAQAQGDNDEAIARLTEALGDWRVLGDSRRTAQTLVPLAGIATARGEYVVALELNHQALRLFETINDRAGIAGVLNQLGIIATDQGEYTRARGLYERSGSLYDLIGDRHGSARVLNNLGILAFWQQDYRRAAMSFEDSLIHWRALGDRPHTAVALANLGEALRAEGDLEHAVTVAREGLQISREVGDKRSAATALFILGSLLQHHEDNPQATEPLVEGLLLYQQIGDRLGMAWCLEALAGPASVSERPEVAAQMGGAAEVLREQVGVPLKPAELPAYRRHMDAARHAFSNPDAYHVAWTTGREMALNTVVELAAGLLPDPVRSPEPSQASEREPIAGNKA